MPITTLPIPPNTIRPTTFAAESDAFLAALPTFVTEVNARAAAIDAAVSAAPLATAAAAAAVATAGAVAWASGTYALNANAISQIDFQTYRKKTASSATTVDPSADATNWTPVSLTRQSVVSLTGAYTITTSDIGKVFICTGTFTLSYDTALTAGLGNGFFCTVKNEGGGIITHDPSGSQTINTVATIAQKAGDTYVVYSDGANLRSYRVGARNVVVFTTGQTWAPPYPCVAKIIVTGGGGSNALKSGSYDGCTSAGAGGTAIKFAQALSPAVTYTVVVGGGGAMPTTTAGYAGTVSSFSGSGITTLTGNGGSATAYHSTSASNAITFVNGGTATGGDLNLTGAPGHGQTTLYPTTIGSTTSSPTFAMMGTPCTASYWGAGNPVYSVAPANYGAGACGIGVNTSACQPGQQGVVIVEFE